MRKGTIDTKKKIEKTYSNVKYRKKIYATLFDYGIHGECLQLFRNGMYSFNGDDTRSTSTLQTHKLGAGELRIVSNERVQRRIDLNVRRIN